MCVRYTLQAKDAARAALARALARELAPIEGFEPRYNAAPSALMPAAAAGPEGPRLRRMRWGLPARAGAEVSGSPPFLPNARAERARSAPTFRRAVAGRRCLVPADGFYEWSKAGRARRPHFFTVDEGAVFAFAGIWEPAEADRPETYAILTTEPNALVAEIHDRMPVLLTAETMPLWLGAEPLAEGDYAALTRPLPPERMRRREVAAFVNRVQHEGPGCLAPPEAAPPELF